MINNNDFWMWAWWVNQNQSRTKRINYYDTSGKLTHYTIEEDITPPINWRRTVKVILITLAIIVALIVAFFLIAIALTLIFDPGYYTNR